MGDADLTKDQGPSVNLFPSAVSGTGASAWFEMDDVDSITFDIQITGTATVAIEASNDPSNTVAHDISSGGYTASDYVTVTSKMAYVRANVSAYTSGDVDVWVKT